MPRFSYQRANRREEARARNRRIERRKQESWDRMKAQIERKYA